MAVSYDARSEEPVGIVISRGGRPPLSLCDRVPAFTAYVWAPAPELPDTSAKAGVVVEA